MEKKLVVKKEISFGNYREKQTREFYTIRSHGHEVYTEKTNKVALSADDDKRVILGDRINTLAIRHYKTL